MIERLKGIVESVGSESIVVDVAGVGYGLSMPLNAICSMTNGQEVTIFVHTHVREDTLKLFGFLTQQDCDIFRLLTKVNGIGPKAALAILSTLSVSEICYAIDDGDAKRFSAAPGVGLRTAEKIVVELRNKIPQLAGKQVQGALSTVASGASSFLADLESALSNLGFKSKQLDAVLPALCEEYPNESLQFLMKQALLRLSGSKAQSPKKKGSQVSGAL